MRNAAYILAILLLLPACGRHDSTIPGDNDSEKTTVTDKGQDVTTSRREGSETEQDLNQDIFKAVKCGNVEAVRLYIGRGGDPDSRIEINGQKYALIHLAAKNGHAELIDMLITNGADINSPTTHQYELGGPNWGHLEYSQAPLHLAVKYCKFSAVKSLIHAGANVNSKGHRGKTPLHFIVDANKGGLHEKGTLLINSGADVNAKDVFGRTPLLAAAGKNNCEATEWLLENGADISATDRFGKTALDIAFEKYHIPMIILLHKHGVPTKREVRTLAEAVLLEDIEKVRSMLENGYWVDESISYFQYTPLHIASLYGNTEIAELLLKGKADVNIRDWKKLTALDFAKTKEMKKLLRKHGAVSGKELKEKEEK